MHSGDDHRASPKDKTLVVNSSTLGDSRVPRADNGLSPSFREGYHISHILLVCLHRTPGDSGYADQDSCGCILLLLYDCVSVSVQCLDLVVLCYVAQLIVGARSGFLHNAAPLLLNEISYPTHRPVANALFMCGYYLGALILLDGSTLLLSWRCWSPMKSPCSLHILKLAGTRWRIWQ